MKLDLPRPLITYGFTADSVFARVDLIETNLLYQFLRILVLTGYFCKSFYQKVKIEGFSNIVAGPQISGFFHRFHIMTSTDDHNRDFRKPTNLLKYIKPINIRKSEINKHDIKPVGFQLFNTSEPLTCGNHF